MLLAVAKLLWLLSDLHSLMFGGNLGGVIVLVALHAKVCILSDTEEFSRIRGNFSAVVT